MSKIKFSLKFWKNSIGTKQQQTDEKIQVIRNSNRHYQSISVDCRLDKNLSLDFWNLLETLSPSIIELRIKSIKLDNPSPLNLPKLEILKLTYVPTNIRNVLITASRSLKKLKLKMESPLYFGNKVDSTQLSQTSIRTFLQQNENLKDLELHGSVQYNSFFSENYSDVINFKLQRLKVKSGMRLALISEQFERNFLSFLDTQSQCLKNFYIDVCRPNVIQFAFNAISSLSSLQIDAMVMSVDYKIKDLDLKLNEHIVDLKIPYVSHHHDIREFLVVAPNLTSLFVAHLSHETMEYIAWNLKSLRTLKFRYDEIDCEGFYEILRDDNPEVNQNIEMVVDYEYT